MSQADGRLLDNKEMTGLLVQKDAEIARLTKQLAARDEFIENVGFIHPEIKRLRCRTLLDEPLDVHPFAGRNLGDIEEIARLNHELEKPVHQHVKKNLVLENKCDEQKNEIARLTSIIEFARKHHAIPDDQKPAPNVPRNVKRISFSDLELFLKPIHVKFNNGQIFDVWGAEYVEGEHFERTLKFELKDEKPAPRPTCFGTWSKFQDTNLTRVQCLECKAELKCQCKDEEPPAPKPSGRETKEDSNEAVTDGHTYTSGTRNDGGNAGEEKDGE